MLEASGGGHYLGIGGAGSLRWRALFDIKVIGTDAPSHRNRSPESTLESGAKEKKRIYEHMRLYLSGGETLHH